MSLYLWCSGFGASWLCALVTNTFIFGMTVEIWTSVVAILSSVLWFYLLHYLVLCECLRIAICFFKGRKMKIIITMMYHFMFMRTPLSNRPDKCWQVWRKWPSYTGWWECGLVSTYRKYYVGSKWQIKNGFVIWPYPSPRCVLGDQTTQTLMQMKHILPHLLQHYLQQLNYGNNLSA